MIRVGLTGGIASGKSSVARLLRERHGLPVLDADAVARELVAPGSPLLATVVTRFGAAVLAPGGGLDRAALAAVVLADPVARTALEQITHPAIFARIEAWFDEQRALGRPAAVVEASLLVETGELGRFDRIVVVACTPAIQFARLVVARDMQVAQARAWLAAQAPAEHKERAADVIIRNDGGLEELERAVEAALPAILAA